MYPNNKMPGGLRYVCPLCNSLFSQRRGATSHERATWPGPAVSKFATGALREVNLEAWTPAALLAVLKAPDSPYSQQGQGLNVSEAGLGLGLDRLDSPGVAFDVPASSVQRTYSFWLAHLLIQSWCCAPSSFGSNAVPQAGKSSRSRRRHDHTRHVDDGVLLSFAAAMPGFSLFQVAEALKELIVDKDLRRYAFPVQVCLSSGTVLLQHCLWNKAADTTS